MKMINDNVLAELVSTPKVEGALILPDNYKKAKVIKSFDEELIPTGSVIVCTIGSGIETPEYGENHYIFARRDILMYE